MNYNGIIKNLLALGTTQPTAAMAMAQSQKPPFVVFNVENIVPDLYVGNDMVDVVNYSVAIFDTTLARAQSTAQEIRTAIVPHCNYPILHNYMSSSQHIYLDDLDVYMLTQNYSMRLALHEPSLAIGIGTMAINSTFIIA